MDSKLPFIDKVAFFWQCNVCYSFVPVRIHWSEQTVEKTQVENELESIMKAHHQRDDRHHKVLSRRAPRRVKPDTLLSLS